MKSRAPRIVLFFTVLVLMYSSSSSSFAQKFLRITSVNFGAVKIREIENHTLVRYRAAGSVFGRRATLIDMKDSTLFFDNSDAVPLQNLKGIGVRSEAPFPRVMQKLFFYTGFGLIPLSVINKVITGQEVNVTRTLVYVSASALTGGLITMWLRNKRTHTGRHKVLQIKERDPGYFNSRQNP